ncbi:fibronectin type III domain-containing protein [Candidatus Poriferisodalis sp.]|uniref:fibronectin type III domain-containing protein n=1 Tax=Candidatus Poriferisodalis sp. TaxID=3101277 RepID=UPI003B5A7074
MVLSWDDPGDGTIDGYVILRRVRGVDAQGVFSELVADTGSAAAGYTDLAVAAGTSYTYRVKAVNEHGASRRSRWVHIDTPPAPVPAKPTGLSAVGFFDRVVLSWDDPGDGSVVGYVVLRRVRGVDAQGVFSELVADTGSAVAGYTDGAVAAGTSYTYRVKAVNEHGPSERSRWFHVDTPAAPEAVVIDPGGPDEGDQGGQGGNDGPVGASGRGASGGVGTRANVSEPVGEDFPGTTSTTGEVDVGGSVTGNIDQDTDVDGFTVDLVAGTAYEIAVRGFFTDFEPGVFNLPSRVPNYGYASARYSLGAPFVVVLDSEDDPLGAGRSSWVWSSVDPCRPLFFERRDPVVEFTPDETGAYTISVGSLGAGSYWKRSAPDSNGDCGTTQVRFGATGTYEVSVREWPPHIAEPVRPSSNPSEWFWVPSKDREPIPKEQHAEEIGTPVSEVAPDTYGRGETIEYEVTFTEAVNVAGTPALYLRGTSGLAGRGDRWAQYAEGTGTDTLVFAYTVRAGDYDESSYKTGAWLGGGKRLHFRLRAGDSITGAATGSHAVLESYHGSSHSVAGQQVNGSVTTP